MALVLILIAFPSFKLLYLMDEVNDPAMTILAEGQGGPESYILNKIEDTYFLILLLIGQRKITPFKNNFNTHSHNFHTRMKAGSRIGPHNWDVVSVLVGSLLGDCSCLKTRSRMSLMQYSTKINNPEVSTCLVNKSNINPKWVSGFADGESSFIVSIIRSNQRSIGWSVKPLFAIELHGKDIGLLKQIQEFFGLFCRRQNTGNIIISSRNGHAIYSIKSAKIIYSTLLPHFIKYPLNTQKSADFMLFKTIVELINTKEHLTINGLSKIVSLRASLNKGLSDELAESFSSIKPVVRPNVFLPDIPLDMNWLSGFINGEGSFYVNIPQDTTKLGFSVKLNFSIAQHIRDKNLFQLIKQTLGCGHVYEDIKYSRVDFRVTNFREITNILIPFFEKYPIRAVKFKDYEDFVSIAKFIENKEHLTLEGLEKIKHIKSGMNIRRNYTEPKEDSQGPLLDSLLNNSLNISKLVSKTQKRDFHTRAKADKRIGPHSSEVISVIIGSLLGEASGNYRSGEGARFAFKQSIIHKEYLFWLYNFFYSRGYTNSEPRLLHKNLKRDNKNHPMYEFNTFTFRSFNWIYDMFYKRGKKYINLNLESYLTPLALAVWIMSNGKYVNGGVQLYTYFHTSQDVDKLITMLNNSYGLNCFISERKQGLYKIVIAKEYVKLLQTIVLPHVIPNMKYKIGIYKSSTFSSNSEGNKKGKRFYTTKILSANPLNPYYVTGFADGESNFTIIITENKTLKVGWRVHPSFQINLHIKDLDLLNKLKSFFSSPLFREGKTVLVKYIYKKILVFM